MSIIIVALTLFVTISNGQLSYTTASQVTGDITCAANQDCTLSCVGILACVKTGGSSTSIYTVNGPSGYGLTINVDSQGALGATTQTFNLNVNCVDCSFLTINVVGNGRLQLSSNNIYTPTNGLATIDCSGPTLSAGTPACYSINIRGANGFGTGAGQTYIPDVSASNRFTENYVSYYCTNSGVCRGLNSNEGMQWNSNGYLECATTLACQTEVDPGCIYSLTDYLDNCYCDGGSTAALTTGSDVSFELEKESVLSVRGDSAPAGFVIVPEFDYYFMRGCMVVVLIGFCVAMIKAFIIIIRDNNKNSYKYGKVQYDTEMTEIEN